MDSPVEQWEGGQWEEEDAEEEVPVEQDDDIQVADVHQASSKPEAPDPREPEWAPPAADQHRLIGGRSVRRPPGPFQSASQAQKRGCDNSVSQLVSGARVPWKCPKHSRKSSATRRHALDCKWDLLRTPRFWNQWIREEEIVDVIHYNKKSRFQVGVRDGRYLARAMQGHSTVHVRDELLLTLLTEEEAQENAAHGTYYDFYESILKHGLVAGGLQGAAFRRHIHMVATLPWKGPISGMRPAAT